MTHVTSRLTAKDRDQLRNPTLGNRTWDIFTVCRLQCTDSVANLHCTEVVLRQPEALLLNVGPLPLKQMYKDISTRTTVIGTVILTT